MYIDITYYPHYPAFYTSTTTNAYVSQQVTFPSLHHKDQHQLYLEMGSQNLSAGMVSLAYPNCSLHYATALHPNGYNMSKCWEVKANTQKWWRMMMTF